MSKSFNLNNSHKLQSIGLLKTLQIISFDVVLGALCSGIMAVKVFNVMPGIYWWIILAISVWLVYSVDHLSDGLRLGYSTKSLRHLFHFKYRKLFIVAIIIFGSLAAYIAFFMLNYAIIFFGFIVGSLVLLYLIANVLLAKYKTVFFQKELFIAVLYTYGIWGGPMAISGNAITMSNIILIVMFAMVAFTNLSVFAYFEHDSDQSDNQFSIVDWLGSKGIVNMIYAIAVLLLFLAITVMIILPSTVQIIIAGFIILLMEVVLILLLKKQAFFSINDRYRFFGDLVFILPVLMIFI